MSQIRLATLADIPRLSEIRLAVRENQLSNPGRITVADYEDYVAGRGRSWPCGTLMTRQPPAHPSRRSSSCSSPCGLTLVTCQPPAR